MTAVKDNLGLSEKGRDKKGQSLFCDERLFIQLYFFDRCASERIFIRALNRANISGVLYRDLHNPHGIALLVFAKDPTAFFKQIQPFLRQKPFSKLFLKSEQTLCGRTYTIGYENDLHFVLFDRPIKRLLNSKLNWAIWYPLRRKPEFEVLPKVVQTEILKEHGAIGMEYASADLVYDVRLASHGLNKQDNDFIIGLLSRELHPLSVIVQRMRRTKQTSQYLESLGPFFVGKVAWQSRCIL